MHPKPTCEAQISETARRKHRLYPTLHNIGIREYFLIRDSFFQEFRPTLGKWDLIKLKSFCTDKETAE